MSAGGWTALFLPLFATPLACLSLAAGLSAEEDAAAAPQHHVARLIQQLGADSYQQRRQADAALATLGSQARDALQAAAESDHPETRLRAQRLLQRLKIVELWSDTEFVLEAGPLPAATAFQRIAQRSGNQLTMQGGQRALPSTPVTLNRRAGRVKFWPVLDALCRHSATHVRPSYDASRGGLVIVAGGPGEYPLAYAGPIRAHISSARRQFLDQFDYETLESDLTHSFRLNLQAMWEDRFRLVAYRAQPELVEAVTDTGQVLELAEHAEPSWNLAPGGKKQLTASLLLRPPPTTARQLERLVLRWELVAVTDWAHLDIDDPTSGAARHQDDVQITVERFRRNAEGDMHMVLVIARHMAIPDPREVLFQENQVELLDCQGRRLKQTDRRYELTPSGARIKITCRGGGDQTPLTLRLTYPQIRSRKHVELVFGQVPLPTAAP